MPARFNLILLDILSLVSLSSLYLVMADGRQRNVSVVNFNGSSFVDLANTVLTESN